VRISKFPPPRWGRVRERVFCVAELSRLVRDPEFKMKELGFNPAYETKTGTLSFILQASFAR